MREKLKLRARACHELGYIDIIDDETKTVYRCSACTNWELMTCWIWTPLDCKEFIKEHGGAKVLTLEEGGYKK